MGIGTALERVEIRQPFPFAVFHVAVAVFPVDGVLPPGTPVGKSLIFLLFAEGKGQLGNRPVIVTVLHRIGIAPEVIRYIMVFQVGQQVAVAGEAPPDLGGRSGLHLDHGSEHLFNVVVADAHLVCAYHLRDLMLSDHHGNQFHSRGTLSEPACRIIQGQLGLDPARTPFRRQQVPDLVEIPESIPERVAAERTHVGVRQGLYLFKLIHPTPVHVVERVATMGTVQVGIETLEFPTVVAAHPHAGEDVVPSVPLVRPDGIEIPAIGIGNLRPEVVVRSFRIHERQARPHTDDILPGRRELDIAAEIFRALHTATISLPRAVVRPAGKSLDVPVKLDGEPDRIELVRIPGPDPGCFLPAIAFHGPGTGLDDLAIHNAVAVLGRDLQVDHHAALLPGGIGVALERAMVGGRQLGQDIVVGKTHRIVPDIADFRGLVDAGTVTGFVSLLHFGLVADLGLEGPGHGHRTQAGHGPFVDMAEGADAFKDGIITALPTAVLVVRAEFDHTEWHPGARGQHPARMGGTHTRVDIVGRGDSLARSPEDLAASHRDAVHLDGVAGACLPPDGRHRCLELVITAFQGLGEDFLPVQFDAQDRMPLQMVHPDDQGLGTSVKGEIGSRRDDAHIGIPEILPQLRRSGSLQTDVVEDRPASLQAVQADFVVSLPDIGSRQRNFQRVRVGVGIVAEQ